MWLEGLVWYRLEFKEACIVFISCFKMESMSQVPQRSLHQSISIYGIVKKYSPKAQFRSFILASSRLQRALIKILMAFTYVTSVILNVCLKPCFPNAAANHSLNSLMLTIDLSILELLHCLVIILEETETFTLLNCISNSNILFIPLPPLLGSSSLRCGDRYRGILASKLCLSFHRAASQHAGSMVLSADNHIIASRQSPRRLAIKISADQQSAHTILHREVLTTFSLNSGW